MYNAIFFFAVKVLNRRLFAFDQMKNPHQKELSSGCMVGKSNLL